METLNEIGGYFELELSKSSSYHKDCYALNSCKNSLELLLIHRKWKHVLVPYYTSSTVVKPLEKLGITYSFYHINETLEPVNVPSLGVDEAFLYTNYFGLKQECVEQLAKKYGEQLIIDNAQAFYAKPLPNIDTIYSARKFFGVSDGGFLYTDCLININEFEQDLSYGRMSHLLKRIEMGAQFGYADYKVNGVLSDQPIKRMSKITERILNSINYTDTAKKRRENYMLLEKSLCMTNNLKLSLRQGDIPMIYPYWTEAPSLRQRLIDNNIYVAQYWPNVLDWSQQSDLEYTLAKNLIPLPIDQRYGEAEMKKIIEIVCGK